MGVRRRCDLHNVGAEIDCEGDQFAWDVVQSNWCCLRTNRGCITTTSPWPQPPIIGGREEADEYMTTTTHMDIDCSTGSPWIWTQEKANWCCELKGIGCFTQPPPAAAAAATAAAAGASAGVVSTTSPREMETAAAAAAA